MTKITFSVDIHASKNNATVTLPKRASDKLPSRGTVMVLGTVNGKSFRAPLEPDGEGSHWFSLDKTGISGKSISFTIEPTKQWPEPKVSADVKKALADDPEAQELWNDITPMARWDWLRWMESVKQEQTRKERPAKLCSMLKAGKRRPCCFNRALMTPPKRAELI